MKKMSYAEIAKRARKAARVAFMMLPDFKVKGREAMILRAIYRAKVASLAAMPA